LKTLLLTLLAGLTLVSAGSLNAEDWIKSKTSDGSIVILDDGSTWKVDSFDRFDGRFWSKFDNVVVDDCDSALINTDTGEKVSATQID
jgi:hypothetical protein